MKACIYMHACCALPQEGLQGELAGFTAITACLHLHWQCYAGYLQCTPWSCHHLQHLTAVHDQQMQRAHGSQVWALDSNECLQCAQAGPPDKYAECLPAGAATDCQLGLTLAHRNVWQAIAEAKQGAAWVFECALTLRCGMAAHSTSVRREVQTVGALGAVLVMRPAPWATRKRAGYALLSACCLQQQQPVDICLS